MAQGRYVQLSEAQRTEVWRRWKANDLSAASRTDARPIENYGSHRNRESGA